MDEKAVATGLFKKLSALRATLSDEEQALLDRMVEGEFDVEAHLRVQPAADDRRPNPDADEAAAHLRVQPAADERRPNPRADEADRRFKALDDDEAVAHKKAPPAADAKVAFRVIYNPDDETYLVE